MYLLLYLSSGTRLCGSWEFAGCYVCVIFLYKTSSASLRTDGTKLTKCSLHGHRNPSFQTLLHWSKQKRPSNATWALFRQIIRTYFCKNNTLELKKHLGQWNMDPSPDIKWNHFYDKQTRKLYIHYDRKYGEWNFHRPISSEKLMFNCSPGGVGWSFLFGTM